MKDLGNAFSFVFRDRNWVGKLVVACVFLLLCLIGLGLFVIAGYLIQLTQRVMRGEDPSLPEWKDIGVKFVTGFKFGVVYVLYLLPILLMTVPLIVMTIASEISPQREVLGLVAGIYAFGFTMLVIPYSLALNLLMPIIVYRYAEHERIADALDISAIVRLFTAHWQDTVVVALISVGIQSFAAVGLIALFVGVLVTIFYAFAVSAYLAGALYREHFPGAGPRAVAPAW
jgi:hypothetical protein